MCGFFFFPPFFPAEVAGFLNLKSFERLYIMCSLLRRKFLLKTSDCGKYSCCLVHSGSYYCSTCFSSETQIQLFPHCKWAPYHRGISCSEVGLVFPVGAVLHAMNNYIFSMWKGVKTLFLLKHSAELSALIVLASRGNWETSIKSRRFVVSVFSWMSTTEVAIPALIRGRAGAWGWVSPVLSDFASNVLG